MKIITILAAENSKNEIYFSNPTGLGYQGIILPNKLLKIKRIIKFGLFRADFKCS